MPPGDVLLAELTAAWLEGHVQHLEAPARYLDSVEVLERFWAELRSKHLLPEPFTVSQVSNALVDQFIAWRTAQGAAAPTISRDLAALRGPINWGLKPENGRLTSAPRIRDVKGRKRPRELEWSPEQIAAILDAARERADRRHVLLFSMIMLSTHARVEATLELDAAQIRRGMIHFLRPGEDQTRKRRTIVPICPTLAPWLEGATGKVIVYRAPIAQRKWQDPDVAEFFERPTNDIGNAFTGVLLADDEERPELDFARQAIDAGGKPLWLPPRAKLGETAPRPRMTVVGTPNTLRHTIHTWHKRFGVPDAQIDAAAGHSEEGTGANYTHLRPEYLRDFIASTEAFWAEVRTHTDAHLRYQRDTNVRQLSSARSVMGRKSA